MDVFVEFQFANGFHEDSDEGGEVFVAKSSPHERQMHFPQLKVAETAGRIEREGEKPRHRSALALHINVEKERRQFFVIENTRVEPVNDQVDLTLSAEFIEDGQFRARSFRILVFVLRVYSTASSSIQFIAPIKKNDVTAAPTIDTAVRVAGGKQTNIARW